MLEGKYLVLAFQTFQGFYGWDIIGDLGEEVRWMRMVTFASKPLGPESEIPASILTFLWQFVDYTYIESIEEGEQTQSFPINNLVAIPFDD